MTRPVADLPDNRLEGELRAAFADATADLTPTPNPWLRTKQAVARSRARRRAGALAGVAVAAVVALVAVVHPPVRREAQPAGPRVTASDISGWPTRGNLAGRADLLAAVSAKVADGQLRVVAVPYLGTIDDVTAALVLADDVSGAAGPGRHVVLVYGRQSRPVDVWRTEESFLPPESVPVLTATFFDGGEWSRGIAVTLSQGVRLAWSPRPFADSSGQTVRTFVPLTLDNGVGTWRTRWKAGLVTVRADWSGRRAVLKPQIQGVDEEDVAGNTRALAPEPAPACANDAGYAELAQAGLPNAWGQSAVRRSAVTKVRLIWCGRVGTERAVLTGVTTNDGTDFQVLSEDTVEGGRHDLTVSAWPVPRGRGLDYPMARQLLVDEKNPGARATVTVVAPQGVMVELQDADGPFSAGQRKLTADGFARFALAPTDSARWSVTRPADLVVLDVHGGELDRVRTPGHDPWGDAIDGSDATTDASPVR